MLPQTQVDSAHVRSNLMRRTQAVLAPDENIHLLQDNTGDAKCQKSALHVPANNDVD